MPPSCFWCGWAQVGVVRQMETAAIKASGSNKYTPFTRKLTAVYTRATLEVNYITHEQHCMPFQGLNPLLSPQHNHKMYLPLCLLLCNTALTSATQPHFQMPACMHLDCTNEWILLTEQLCTLLILLMCIVCLCRLEIRSMLERGLCQSELMPHGAIRN